ncbi:hypothetical protein BDN72DRAFT_801442, partial [Pluteus cervinus]
MALLKIPLIIIDAFNMLLNATPPNPPPPVAEHLIPDWRERFLRSLSLPCRLLRAIYYTSGLIEVVVILASHMPDSSASRFILSTLVSNAASLNRIEISYAFSVGFFLTSLGTFIRLWSYKSLGRLFTFELHIRPDHQLIVDGPYAFIRHPSYTGLILSLTGATIIHLSGSWVKESGVLDTPLGCGIAIYWLLGAGAVMLSLVLRMPNEDRVLRERFGNEWVNWAQRVPHRLVPRLY